MKVLQINNYNYRRGGVDSVYLNIGRLLSKENHDIEYFSSNNINNEFNSEYFIDSIDFREGNISQKITHFNNYFYSRASILKLNRLLDNFKPDISNVHNFNGVLTGSFFKVLNSHNIPIVQTIHDYNHICPVSSMINSKSRICDDCKGKSYYKGAINKCKDGNFINSAVTALDNVIKYDVLKIRNKIDGYIFVSDFAKELYQKYFPFMETKSYKLFNFAPKLNFNNNIHGKNFLYFGRLSKEKGLLTLVKTFKLLGKHKLDIVGDGPLKNTIAMYIQDNKVANINLLGYKDSAQLEQLIANAFFVIVPSEWYENNPMSIIESNAHGTPTIGANIGGIPEIIVDKKTGYLFDFGNGKSLVEVITKAVNLTTAEYIDFRKNAFEFARINFNPDLYKNEIIDIFNEIIRNYDKKAN